MVSPTPLLITLEYPPQVGGVANYYWSLVKALALPCTVADTTVLPKSWWKMIPWLYRQVKQQRYSHILVGQVLPLGTVALAVHWLTNTPYIVFTHGMDVLVPQRYFRKRWLLRRILRSAQHIIAASQFTADQIKQLEPAVTVTVIHPAAAITPSIIPQTVAGVPDRFILSVGRLVERKGFNKVIQALNNFPDLHYVIAGNGDPTNLIDQARHDGVEGRVHFFQQLTNAEIVYLYQQCLFLAMPSRQLPDGDVEGFGIVILEAACFGKTTIGGTAGGMADAIQDGQTGLLIDGNNVTELVTAIRKMLNDGVRKKLEDQAKQYSERVTWEHAAHQLSAIVNGHD